MPSSFRHLVHRFFRSDNNWIHCARVSCLSPSFLSPLLVLGVRPPLYTTSTLSLRVKRLPAKTRSLHSAHLTEPYNPHVSDIERVNVELRTRGAKQNCPPPQKLPSPTPRHNRSKKTVRRAFCTAVALHCLLETLGSIIPHTSEAPATEDDENTHSLTSPCPLYDSNFDQGPA